MPLGNDQWVMRFTTSGQSRGVPYVLTFCEPDASVCGRRKVDTELYEPDFCWSEYDGSDLEIPFESTGFSNERFEAGWFAGLSVLEQIEQTRVHCNDLPYFNVDIPPRFQLTAPLATDSFSRSAQSSIRIEWSPAASGLPMMWKLIPVDNELTVLACDMLPWQTIEEQGTDEGFAEISMDRLPSNLPAEGCDVIVTVSRLKAFDLPEGVSKGSILSRAVDGVIFRIKP